MRPADQRAGERAGAGARGRAAATAGAARRLTAGNSGPFTFRGTNTYLVGEREVAARLIGDMVMEELRSLDEVAYVRFASVYRQFKDLDDFMSELRNIIGKNDAT